MLESFWKHTRLSIYIYTHSTPFTLLFLQWMGATKVWLLFTIVYYLLSCSFHEWILFTYCFYLSLYIINTPLSSMNGYNFYSTSDRRPFLYQSPHSYTHILHSHTHTHIEIDLCHFERIRGRILPTQIQSYHIRMQDLLRWGWSTLF